MLWEIVIAVAVLAAIGAGLHWLRRRALLHVEAEEARRLLIDPPPTERSAFLTIRMSVGAVGGQVIFPKGQLIFGPPGVVYEIKQETRSHHGRDAIDVPVERLTQAQQEIRRAKLEKERKRRARAGS